VQSNNVPAPPIETPPAASPRSTVQASRPQSDSTASSVVDSFSNWNSIDVAVEITVPISTLTRTNYVAPKYPRAAQRRNVTGSVDVMFTVSTDGTVTDISIVRAEPEKTFNEAAMDAVAQWRFQPVIENGLAVEKRTAIRLGFDLH
jgi:protein TonB